MIRIMPVFEQFTIFVYSFISPVAQGRTVIPVLLMKNWDKVNDEDSV